MLIDMNDIFKIYQMGSTEVRAVDGISLCIEQGEFTTIMGQSGSGKSTLMHILGCLDTPSSGNYLFDGVDVSKIDDISLSNIRNRKVGFVFQSFNLLSHRDILHNVSLPMIYMGDSKIERDEKSKNILQALGLGNRIYHKPTELSGGQNQRVAISRALANNPKIILADEPTGNLDSKTSLEILALFQRLNELGKTIIMVTHDREVSNYSKRIIEVRDGKIISDKANNNYKIIDVKLSYNVEVLAGIGGKL
ncbi:MAG: ABC transporter ATP-binding protein [Candidatus Muirbacterium halophilum]|nr:ABC transporter ATP-binding protein [Candidatus Muirbacterium halophilum]MCK9474975.1 ABC transporter ATP-binding protein [Candidatus Muirbacterium halophilum]